MESVSDYQHEVYDRQDYDTFLTSIQCHFDNRSGPFFTTNAKGLFSTFLAQFPEGEIRQHYTCHSCCRFVDTFGGIVTITNDGYTVPAIWPDSVPEFYQESVAACKRIVKNAKVTGVFLSPLPMWGQAVTGKWHHMHVNQNDSLFREGTLTAFQAMAQKKQDYVLISRSLDRYDIDVIDQAITLLEIESLTREEKSLASAVWFRDLIEKRIKIHGPRRANIVWKAVATAPAGWAHIKNNMFGTLLQDIDDGYSFPQIKRRFTNKMHPLQYQRPQAAPKKGAIKRANEVVAKLQSAGALKRRFATFEEVRDKMIWIPNQADWQAQRVNIGDSGPFDRLLSSPQNLALHAQSKNITWGKFRDTVLQRAQSIQFFAIHGNYSAITTCADPVAPPILQWDFDNNRNPFSQYVYHGGSTPERWSLSRSTWHNVIGICYQPSQWTSTLEHHGQSIFFILENCRDAGGTDLAIFPETLRTEYHEVRSSIEQFSKTGEMGNADGQLASGIRLGKRAAGLTFRVQLGKLVIDYKIDRWD